MAGVNEILTLAQILPRNLTKSFSFKSTAFSNIYLRADTRNRVITLQVGRAGWQRPQLIRQPEAEYGPNVLVIGSLMIPEWGLHLDPTVLSDQALKPGSTFHPNQGCGKTSLVCSIREASRFTAVVNDVDIVSFRLDFYPQVGEELLPAKNCFLRFNGNAVDGFDGAGLGEVNGQTYIGPFEKFLVERFP